MLTNCIYKNKIESRFVCWFITSLRHLHFGFVSVWRIFPLKECLMSHWSCLPSHWTSQGACAQSEVVARFGQHCLYALVVKYHRRNQYIMIWSNKLADLALEVFVLDICQNGSTFPIVLSWVLSSVFLLFRWFWAITSVFVLFRWFWAITNVFLLFR